MRSTLSRRLAASAAAVLLLGAGAARLFAEDLDVPKLFDSGKQAFGEKRYGKAWQDVQLIAAEVARMRLEALKEAMPAAPKDWTGEEAEAEGGGGWAWVAAGFNVHRRMTKGEASADAWIRADAATLLQVATMMIQNPAMLQPGWKIVTVQGRKGLLEYRKDDKSGKLTVLLNVPNALFEIEARGVTPQELGETLPAGFDLAAIEKAVAN
jgi:hypothetical protein